MCYKLHAIACILVYSFVCDCMCCSILICLWLYLLLSLIAEFVQQGSDHQKVERDLTIWPQGVRKSLRHKSIHTHAHAYIPPHTRAHTHMHADTLLWSLLFVFRTLYCESDWWLTFYSWPLPSFRLVLLPPGPHPLLPEGLPSDPQHSPQLPAPPAAGDGEAGFGSQDLDRVSRLELVDENMLFRQLNNWLLSVDICLSLQVVLTQLMVGIVQQVWLTWASFNLACLI